MGYRLHYSKYVGAYETEVPHCRLNHYNLLYNTQISPERYLQSEKASLAQFKLTAIWQRDSSLRGTLESCTLEGVAMNA